MRRILILALGSAGDVYPFIAIGQALRRRGRDVTLVASANFRQRVENAGLDFVSGLSQEDLDQGIADPQLWHPQKGFATIWKHMARHLPAAYAQQLALIEERPSIIVASTLGLTGRMLQETHGVPLATVHLAPSVFFSAHDTAVRGGVEWMTRLPPWAVRMLLGLIERAFVDPIIRPAVNRLRASLGLASVRRVMSRWLHSPQRVICAFPDWFAAPQPDWPPNSVCTGFPRMPAAPDETLSAELQQFLADGPAPVAITPGSAMAHGGVFIERAIAAATSLNQRVLVITPYRDQLPAVLPASVLHCAYAPFDLLAPRVSAFAHHGGIGTSAMALAAGKPQLIAPFSFDQPDNAARLIKLGVAASVAPHAPVEAWTKALSRLLFDPGVAPACAAAAQRIHAERPAAEQIADLIEQLDTPS
jgi:rhamnosyltransferase subunit B